MQQALDPGADVVGAASASSKSAASWPSIIAGAFVAISATLILTALGSALGFASVSPWPDRGATITAFAVTTAIWLIVTQWLSSALGGYIAGRLRTRWIGTHTHEVFFRDTAHGLVTWAVATVVVTAIAAMTITSGAGAGTRAVAEVASGGLQGAAQGASQGASTALSNYGIDKLFRPNATGASGSQAPSAGMPAMPGMAGAPGGGPPPAGVAPDARAEASHILANAMTTGSVPDADKSYLVSQVAARTGVSQADAQSRVDAFVAEINEAQNKVRADADAARKAAAETSIYLALSMLIGAFIASVTAALGGRLRDEHI